MTSSHRLGDYLRARREIVHPEDVGLTVDDSRRRVPGLRREEVAHLASISTDYYLRLEQGRDANPSRQVLDALAVALCLDQVATDYLRSLVRPEESAPSVGVDDVVSDATRWLIESWTSTAAVVHNRYIDVLASNRLARAISPNFTEGVNSVVALLGDPGERALHGEWEGLVARSVALLRRMADSGEDDPRLAALVARCEECGPLFRALWHRQDVHLSGNGVHVLHHPIVGDLSLRFARAVLEGTDGQSLFLYFAEPGTPSAAAMAALAAQG
jgi:transcriptional regulator with XRE-family HTH domain